MHDKSPDRMIYAARKPAPIFETKDVLQITGQCDCDGGEGSVCAKKLKVPKEDSKNNLQSIQCPD